MEHQIFIFGKMILRDRRSTLYDLASLFRGRRTTLDRWSGKIGKGTTTTAPPNTTTTNNNNITLHDNYNYKYTTLHYTTLITLQYTATTNTNTTTLHKTTLDSLHCTTTTTASTSSTAQGGGGSFKNRKPIGEVGCCESGMAERSH